MAEPTYIALWIDPDVDALVDRFKKDFEKANWRIERSKTPEDALFRLTFDQPEIDLVLLEVAFSEEKQDIGFDLLRRIRRMDPDIPILVITSQLNSETYHAAGRATADVIDRTGLLKNPRENVVELLAKIRELRSANPTYDIEQRKLANRVASYYEEMESQRPGTVAYWLFEEELIKQIIVEKEKALVNKSLTVLDVGCGTGREAHVVLKTSPTARVTCVDFSGHMLLETSKTLEGYVKGGRCVIDRSLAERLPEDYTSFDVVLLAFAFPCYTATTAVLREASRVIKDDGILFASIYNHDALAYDTWKGQPNEDEPQRPISTWIDRESGKVWIRTKTATPEVLRARTYTTSHFARELRQAGFFVGGYFTFPVLYSVFSCAQIEGRAEQDRREECYSNKQFSHALFGVDHDLSYHLKDKGFYGIFIASRSETSLKRITEHLHLHPIDALKA